MTRTFIGYRPQPPAEYAEKGITNSGTAPDYEGVIFSDGTVVIRWQTAYRSHSVWSCWEDFYQVHGHPEYGTIIEFADGRPEPAPTEHCNLCGHGTETDLVGDLLTCAECHHARPELPLGLAE